MIRILTLLLSLTFSFSVWASSPQNQPGCSKLKAACEKAGFKPSGKKGHKLVEDCVKKVTSGQKVKGIKLKSKDKAVTSCKEVMNMAGKRPTAKAKKKAPKVEGSTAPDVKSEESNDIETPDIPPPSNNEDDQPNSNPIEE